MVEEETEAVWAEARDENIPFFERIKFLSITSSNLDEFFMVRIASLKDMVHAGYEKEDIAGLTPGEQLKKLYKEVHEFVELQYDTYENMVRPGFEKSKLKLIEHHEDLNESEAK